MLGAATLIGEGAHEELPPVEVALQPGPLLRGGELRELRARLVVDEVRVEDLEQLLVGRLARA